MRIDHTSRALSFGSDLNYSTKEDSPVGPFLQNMPSAQIRNQLTAMSSSLAKAIQVIKPASLLVRQLLSLIEYLPPGQFYFSFIINCNFAHSKNMRSRISRPSQPTWRMPAKSISASSLVDKRLRNAKSVWKASTSRGRKRSWSNGRQSFRRCARLRRSVLDRRPKSEKRSASCKNTSKSKRRQCVSDWSRSRRLSWEPRPSKTLILRYWVC